MLDEDDLKQDLWDLKGAAHSELEHIIRLGSDPNLILASANLGAYEAVLNLIASGDQGVPVYNLVTSVRSRFASQAGIISRIRSMRERGLIDEREGTKKSQVCLVPSERLVELLGPVLLKRHG